MKLATKIGAGYAILMVLMIAALSYQTSLTYSLQSINQKLSQVNFRAASLAHQLRQDLDLIEEFTRKFFVARDMEFHEQMVAMRRIFAEDLRRIQALNLSPGEIQQVERLYGSWEEYETFDIVEGQGSTQVGERVSEMALESHLHHLQTLGDQTEDVLVASRRAIAEGVQEATRSGRRSDWVSLVAAVVALGLSIGVCVLTLRSISTQLHRLTEGTREVAKGHFGYRLGSSGNDEFSEVLTDFNSMAQRLDELDRVKRDFVSHVSHELKTPLGSIQETIRLLLEEIPGPLGGKQRRLLQLNLHSAERLSAMIRNLLDLSRIEAGVMDYDFREHDLVGLAESVLSEFEPQLRDKDLCFQAQAPEDEVGVECDEIRIRQLLENLLGNALKFSPRGGAIGVRIKHVDTIPPQIPSFLRYRVPAAGNGFALLTVSDCGSGVPAKDKERIFDRFCQIQRGKKMAGQGVGLGLAICRNIVEAHQGAIWVEDRPGGGSVFSVLMRSNG